MAKRITAVVLTLVLLLGLVPLPAAAAEPESCYITVFYGLSQEEDTWTRKTLMNVYKDGQDLLFSASDLALISGFRMEYDEMDSTLTFTRNSKEIIVYLKESTFSRQYTLEKKDLPSKVRYINGEYYLSGAGMLPWLSLRYSVEDGMLLAIPVPVSYWDLFDNSLADYEFRLSTCAQILGISEKDVSALIYTEKSKSSVILDFITGGDTSTTDTQEFYNLFYDFFMDRSATSRAVGYMNAQNFALAEMTKDIGDIVSFAVDSTQVEVATEAMSTVLDAAMNIVKIMAYTSLYEEDNTLKISMMQSLINNRGANYDPEMIEAARQIVGAFTDYFTGISYFLGYTLLDGISDKLKELAQPDIMQMLGIAGYSSDPDQSSMKRLDSYLILSDAGQYIYNKGDLSGAKKNLTDSEAHAMLHLYAVEQAYRTFAQYVIDSQGTWDQLDAFLALAAEAEKMYGKFLAAAEYVNEDICSFSHVQKRTEELLKEFGKITRQSDVSSDIVRSADQGIYLAALMDMGIGNLKWHQGDLDGDGMTELLVQGMAAAGHQKYPHYEPSYIVLDGPMAESITPNGAAGFSFPVQSKDGTQYYVRYDYTTAANIENTSYRWNGRQWQIAAQYRHFPEYDVNGNPIEVDQYFVAGQQVTQAVYEQDHLSTLNLTADPAFNNQNLLDITFSGKPEDLIRQLNEYYADMAGILSTDAGLDQDNDRVYIISGAANRFTDQITDRFSAGKEVHLNYSDEKTTIILAENIGTGIRLRICRVDAEDDTRIDVAPGGILIGAEQFYYCPTGAPYVKGNHDGSLMEMMMKSADQISSASDRAAFSDSGTELNALLGGGYARFNFSSGVSTGGYMYNDNPAYGYFTDTLPLNLLAGQFMDGLSPRTEWTAETPTGSSESYDSHYYRDCYYFDTALSQVFRVRLTQMGKGYSGTIVSVDARLVTDVSDDLRRQLGIPADWQPWMPVYTTDLAGLLGARYSELEVMMDSFTPEPSYPVFVSAQLQGSRIDLLFPDQGSLSDLQPMYIYILPTVSTFTICEGITSDMDADAVWEKIPNSYGWQEPYIQYGPSNEYLYHEISFYYLCPTTNQIYMVRLCYDAPYGEQRVDYSSEQLRTMAENYCNENLAGEGETYVIFDHEVIDSMNECTLYLRGQFPNADQANVLVAVLIINKDTGVMAIDYGYTVDYVDLYAPQFLSALSGKKMCQINAELLKYPPSDVVDYFYN